MTGGSIRWELCHRIGLCGLREQTQIPDIDLTARRADYPKGSQSPGEPVVKPWLSHW